MGIHKVRSGTIIPRADGKLIDEHVGAVQTGADGFSLARMEAPTGWSEPAQRCRFSETVIVVSGVLAVEGDGERHLVQPGESCLVEPETVVRYSTGSDQVCHYWSICVPAFRPDRLEILE